MDKRLKQGRTTKGQLIATATELFGERGYEATSIELVLQRAGVSRGSLYHHFASKEALFEAVLDDVEARVARELMSAARQQSNAIEALKMAAAAWLDLAKDGQVRQIVLTDAPGALGWARWRAIDERHAFGLLKAAVRSVGGRADGRPPRPARRPRNHTLSVDITAHLLLAGWIEMAIVVAGSDHPDVAAAECGEALDALIEALLAPAKGQ